MSKSMNLVRSAFLLAVLTALGACAMTTAPSSPTDAAVTPRRAAPWSDQSYYLVMRDGVRVALSLYFPEGTPPQDAPTILVQTRYGRAAMFQAGGGITHAGRVQAMWLPLSTRADQHLRLGLGSLISVLTKLPTWMKS